MSYFKKRRGRPHCFIFYKARERGVIIIRTSHWPPQAVRPRPALSGQLSASTGHIAQKKSLTGHRGLVMNIDFFSRSLERRRLAAIYQIRVHGSRASARHGFRRYFTKVPAYQLSSQFASGYRLTHTLGRGNAATRNMPACTKRRPRRHSDSTRACCKRTATDKAQPTRAVCRRAPA